MEEKSEFIKKLELGHTMIADGLKTAPVVFVQGVASPSGGVSCGRTGGEELWDLSMSFDAWRIDGEPLRKQRLSIRGWKITEKEIAYWYNEIHRYSVVRIKARVVPDLPLGFSFGSLESYEGIVTNDAELNDYAKELQKPVTFEDPVLGLFTLDRGLDWYSAELFWEGEKITFHVNTNKTVIIPATLDTAHTLWQEQHLWNQRIRDYAVQELLPLKNDGWLDEEESKLTADQFKARMSLESITVYINGSFSFSFDDGDLFFGHSIEISGSISEGPTRADIPG